MCHPRASFGSAHFGRDAQWGALAALRRASRTHVSAHDVVDSVVRRGRDQDPGVDKLDPKRSNHLHDRFRLSSVFPVPGGPQRQVCGASLLQVLIEIFDAVSPGYEPRIQTSLVGLIIGLS